jgi:predicted nucleic acid-binding protein
VNVYVDASVVLRIVLNEPTPFAEWSQISVGYASALLKVECLRTIDRARVRRRLADEEVANHHHAVLAMLDGLEIFPIDAPILDRAAEPFPTALGTLDSIHLATAMLLRPQVPDLVLATHDGELGVAARAVGFEVYGAE